MKEITQAKLFNFCFSLFSFISIALFLIGFFTNNKVLIIAGGILMFLEQLYDVFILKVVRYEYLYGALIGIIIAALLKKDWYLGAFWYFAIFYFVGIPDDIKGLSFSTKKAEDILKNRELLRKQKLDKLRKDLDKISREGKNE